MASGCRRPALPSPLVIGTLQQSLGATDHALQLIALVLLAQTLVSLRWATTGQADVVRRAPLAMQRQATRATLQVVAATYVLAGITKLLISGGAWMWMTRFVPVQAEKTVWQTYHDTLQAPDPGIGAALNGVCLNHEWFCVSFYGPGLLVELSAFVILFGRGPALAGGVALVMMHRLISLTMGLDFSQHEAIVLIYAVNVPFWALWLLRRGRMRYGRAG